MGSSITSSRDHAHATGRCILRQPIKVPCTFICNAPATFYATFHDTYGDKPATLQRHELPNRDTALTIHCKKETNSNFPACRISPHLDSTSGEIIYHLVVGSDYRSRWHRPYPNIYCLRYSTFVFVALYMFDQMFVAASSQQRIDRIAYGAHALRSVSGGFVVGLCIVDLYIQDDVNIPISLQRSQSNYN